MPRTTPDAVKKLLQKNYDSVNNPDVGVHVSSANVVVTRAIALASSNGSTIPNTTEAELMERWLACYFYCRADPRNTSRSNLGVSGSFDIDPEDFKKQAMEIDPSGELGAALSTIAAGVTWLGKTEREQLTYDERNL